MNPLARPLAIITAWMLSVASANAHPDVLFPPETAGCYVGSESSPAAAGAAPYRKPPVPVSAIRLERSYPQLALEEEKAKAGSNDGRRLIYLRVFVTFADASQRGALKRYANGLYHVLVCSADTCDAGNYKVEREPDGSVLLRMTGGLYVGGGRHGEQANRHLPDGHVYHLVPSPMSACR
jgi:hypothetical protein